MSDKPRHKLLDADRIIHDLPLRELSGMFDGTVLTIKLVMGFEMFNTRPYHNYESWGHGYNVEYNGLVGAGEDLDVALESLRVQLAKRILKDQEGKDFQSAEYWPAANTWVLSDLRMGHMTWCWQEKVPGPDGRDQPHAKVLYIEEEVGFAPIVYNSDGTKHEHLPGFPVNPYWKWRYRLPDGTVGECGQCKSCSANIVWIITLAKKKAPMNPDGTSHFATCPDAERWRARARSAS